MTVSTWTLSVICIALVNGKVDRNVLKTDENWHFLSRYCFRSISGVLQYSIIYPKNDGPLQLYLYYDNPDQWDAVYKKGLTCNEMIAPLKPKNNQVVNLTVEGNYQYSQQDDKFEVEEPGPCKEIGDNFECTGQRTFQSARERWWYIAIGNCNNTNGMTVHYTLEMYNAPDDDWWWHQFSSDEMGILQTDIVFLILEIVLLALSLAVGMALRSRQMFHHTYKIYLVTLILECLALFCDVAAYSRYATDGIGAPFTKLLGKCLRAISTLVFCGLLILLAKGWTITRGRLSSRSTWNLVFFMTIFSLIYAALYIVQIVCFDPAEVLYIYSSGPGYFIIIMRLVAWAWFCYAIYFTLLKYPEKRMFYNRFAMFYSMWFWSGPVTIVLGNFILDNWVREKAANFIDDAVAFVGFAVLLWLIRPSAANVNFPYHVRTTQLSVINENADAKQWYGQATDLPHHAYQVHYTADQDEVFTVANANMQKEAAAYEPYAINGTMKEMNEVIDRVMARGQDQYKPATVHDDDDCSSDEDQHPRV